MTKADIIECVYDKVGGFSKKEAADLVETVFQLMKETLAASEKIKISGFGNFVVREKKQPSTNENAPPVPVGIRRPETQLSSMSGVCSISSRAKCSRAS